MSLDREKVTPQTTVGLKQEIVDHVEQYGSVLEIIDDAAIATWEADKYWVEIKDTAASIVSSIEDIDPRIQLILSAHNGVAEVGPVGRSERARRRSDSKVTNNILSSTRDAMGFVRGCVVSGQSCDQVRTKQTQANRHSIEQIYFPVVKNEDVAKEIADIILSPIERSYDELGPLFEQTIVPENNNVNYIYTYMLLNPTALADFVDWVEGVSHGSDASQTPLLITLANDIADPNGGLYFNRYFNTLLNGTVDIDIKEEFAAYITQQLGDNEESDNLATLRLMRQFFDGTDDEFPQKLFSLSELWDKDLLDRYDIFKQALILQAQLRIAEALKSYTRRSRFFNFASVRSESGVLTVEQRARKIKSNGSRKGGRVTPKKLSHAVALEGSPDDDNKETESTTTLKGISSLKRIPGGFIEQKISDDEIEQMLTQYHQAQGREPKLLEDLYAILGSLLEQPMGKGATKYQGIRINIAGKSHTLLHFSPFHRPGLPMQTGTASKTRFAYTLTQAKGGGYNLAVLGIFHKNDIDDPAAINRIVNS